MLGLPGRRESFKSLPILRLSGSSVSDLVRAVCEASQPGAFQMFELEVVAESVGRLIKSWRFYTC